MITIITGDRGSGKTTLCQRLADEARAAGWDVAGILSPAVFDPAKSARRSPPRRARRSPRALRGDYRGHEKVGIEALDLRTGERRPLARRRRTDEAPAGRHTPGWVFDATTVAWGNDLLATATPCDVLIVDELGPLELEGGQGWTAGLAAVGSGCYRQAWVVVRPELVPLALAHWPHARVVHIAHEGELAGLGGGWPID